VTQTALHGVPNWTRAAARPSGSETRGTATARTPYALTASPLTLFHGKKAYINAASAPE